MNKREVKKIINNEVKQLQHNMFMDGWKIIYKFKKLKVDKAQCTVYGDYQEVVMDIDVSSIKNKADLLDIIRHEFLHCLTPNINRVINWIEKKVSKDAFDLIHQLLSASEEQAVTRLENMLDIGLKMTPERMIK